jgi:hypothetical protein
MRTLKRSLLALSLTLAPSDALAQKAIYAPPPPPMEIGKFKAEPVAQPVASNTPGLFSIGEPTDEEQMHLELINRARADANAEALWLIALSFINTDVREQFELWQVDTNLMKAQFATNPPAAPLSFNAKLTDAARLHSQFQFDNATQTHTGSGGSNPGSRALAAGYSFANLGENVFINATSPEQGHAAFNVDWGPGPGGMQTALGHRSNIHSRSYTEVGIGIVIGTNTVADTTAGPQVVTQDFGRPQAAATYITGVAYYDINGNNFYDPGEGLPGVNVTVDGATASAVTTRSGGFSVPVTPNQTKTLRFNAAGHAELTQQVTVGADNVKRDFKPTYTAPTATGPDTAFSGVASAYNITPFPGATGYRARIMQMAPIAPEGVEGDVIQRWTVTTAGNYPYISSTVRASGTKSFHLGHMVLDNNFHPQILLFNQPIRVGANARIDFQSKMAIATDTQFAALQISTDDGASWTSLWTQFGADIAGEETQFKAKTASLAGYEGKSVRIRYLFDVNGNGYILPDSSDPNFNRFGWFLDDVTFVGMNGVISLSESSVVPQPQFIFTPTEAGTYLLDFQALVGARTFPYGPARTVTVQAASPTVTLLKTLTYSATTLTIPFQVTGGTFGTLQLSTAASPTGPWSVQAAGTLNPLGNGLYTFTTARPAQMEFYRIVAQ